jgi:hypothetical protein
VIADLYTRGSLAGATAFSALPNAPVLPVIDRRLVSRRIRVRLGAVARRRGSWGALARPVAIIEDCS